MLEQENREGGYTVRKSQRVHGLQALHSLAAAHPSTGINKLQMGRPNRPAARGSVCVYLSSLEREQQQQQQQQIILRHDNYMRFKFQCLLPVSLAHRHVCWFTYCLWQLSCFNSKGEQLQQKP